MNHVFMASKRQVQTVRETLPCLNQTGESFLLRFQTGTVKSVFAPCLKILALLASLSHFVDHMFLVFARYNMHGQNFSSGTVFFTPFFVV